MTRYNNHYTDIKSIHFSNWDLDVKILVSPLIVKVMIDY